MECAAAQGRLERIDRAGLSLTTEASVMGRVSRSAAPGVNRQLDPRGAAGQSFHALLPFLQSNLSLVVGALLLFVLLGVRSAQLGQGVPARPARRSSAS